MEEKYRDAQGFMGKLVDSASKSPVRRSSTVSMSADAPPLKAIMPPIMEEAEIVTEKK